MAMVHLASRTRIICFTNDQRTISVFYFLVFTRWTVWKLQQSEFVSSTPDYCSQPGPAAQVFPQAHLLLQVTLKFTATTTKNVYFSGRAAGFVFISRRLHLLSIPSCLIAMALKNSKTGSLPVSEIYSFMKEHFPYFKVRSLNKTMLVN